MAKRQIGMIVVATVYCCMAAASVGQDADARDRGNDASPTADVADDLTQQAASNHRKLSSLARRDRPAGATPPVAWPDPISPEDLDRYFTLMPLPESQAEAAYRKYLAFQERLIDDLDEMLSDVWAHLDSYSETIRRDGSMFERAEVVKAFDSKGYAPAIETIVRHERRFLAELVALIPDEDRRGEAMQRIEDDRRRTRYDMNLGGAMTIPAAHIDLTEMLDAVGELTFDPETKVGRVVIAYLHEIGPLRKRRFEAFLDGRAEYLLGVAEVAGGTREQAAGGRQRCHRARRDQVRADERMQSVNQEYVERFVDVLPDEAAETLRSTFQETSYPQIYPDTKDRMLRQRFDIWLNAWDLTDKQQETVRALRDDYLSWYAQASDRVERAINDYMISLEEDGVTHVDEQQAYQEAIDAFAEERDAKFEHIFRTVTAMNENATVPEGLFESSPGSSGRN